MSFGNTNYRHGGTRGGADQFKWEDVKNDKYRENYLGHSVQAPVGRWQKGKDLSWYTKLSREDRAAALKDEIAMAKQRDQDLMDQALGIAPKKRAEPTGALDASEVKELLKRGGADREGLEAERVEGLGAAPVPEDFQSKPKKTLAEKYQESLARGGGEEDIYKLRGHADATGGSRGDEHDERALRKAAKKQKKKEKKAKKKLKKEKKREHRHRDREESGVVARGRGDRGRRSLEQDDRRSSRRSASSSSSSSPSRSPSPVRRRSDRRSRSPIDRDDRNNRDNRTASTRSRSRSRGRSSRMRSLSRSRSAEYRGRRRRCHSRSRSDSRDRHAYGRR